MNRVNDNINDVGAVSNNNIKEYNWSISFCENKSYPTNNSRIKPYIGNSNINDNHNGKVIHNNEVKIGIINGQLLSSNSSKQR